MGNLNKIFMFHFANRDLSTFSSYLGGGSQIQMPTLRSAVFRTSAQSPDENAVTEYLISELPLPSTAFAIHYSPIVVSFDAMNIKNFQSH